MRPMLTHAQRFRPVPASVMSRRVILRAVAAVILGASVWMLSHALVARAPSLDSAPTDR